MTTPKVATAYKTGGRFYVHPETGDALPGVTSILNALPKPALKPWAAKVVATTAVEQLGTITQMVESGDSEGAIDYLKRSPDRESAPARDFGTAAHDVLETLSYDDEPRYDAYPEAIRDRLRAVARDFNEFRAEFAPDFIMREETVWSDTHGYAGSFDAILNISGETVVLDYKTNKSGVYPETALQLAAYAHADYVLGADGSRSELPEIDGAAVLWINGNTPWKLYPARIDTEVFDVFLALRSQVFPWHAGGGRSAIGKPVNAGAQKRKARGSK